MVDISWHAQQNNFLCSRYFIQLEVVWLIWHKITMTVCHSPGEPVGREEVHYPLVPLALVSLKLLLDLLYCRMEEVEKVLTVQMQHLLKRLLPQFSLQRGGSGVEAGRRQCLQLFEEFLPSSIYPRSEDRLCKVHFMLISVSLRLMFNADNKLFCSSSCHFPRQHP